MDLTEIIEELCENYPDKMVVDISDFENEEHQSYKHLYEAVREDREKLEESNFTLATDRTNMEKELSEALAELKELKHKNYIISQSLLPTMDSIKSFCMEKILVTNISIDPEHVPEEIYDIEEFASTISDKPGIYGKYRPSWFTPLEQELSKKSIQRKNVSVTSAALIEKIKFWKKAGKKVSTNPEQVAAEYDCNRKDNILKLISSDCSNEEKYLKYFLMTPGLSREYLKTLEGASELNINAKLLISLLEQPGDHYNKNIIETYVSKLHKGTEYNLKQELAEELIRGDWYITANINGVEEKFQAVPVGILNNLVNKINAICNFLDSSADDELSAKLAESSSNGIQEPESVNSDSDNEMPENEEVPSFVEFDDSMI